MTRDLWFLINGNSTWWLGFFGMASSQKEEAREMQIPEAKNYLGRDCTVTFRDRKGDLHTQTTHVHDITFVPMYGGCLVGDIDDIWLDRITSISALE